MGGNENSCISIQHLIFTFRKLLFFKRKNRMSNFFPQLQDKLKFLVNCLLFLYHFSFCAWFSYQGSTVIKKKEKKKVYLGFALVRSGNAALHWEPELGIVTTFCTSMFSECPPKAQYRGNNIVWGANSSIKSNSERKLFRKSLFFPSFILLEEKVLAYCSDFWTFCLLQLIF